MKWKKITAVALALTLILAAMTGCGVSDMKYLALYNEVGALENYSFSGDFTLEFDPDYFYSDSSTKMTKIYTDFSGNVSLTDDGAYLDCKIKFGINDAKMPGEFNLLLTNDAIYIPIKDYIGVYSAVALKFSSGYSDKMRAAITSALEEALSEYDYIKITDFSEDPNSMIPLGQVIPGRMGAVNAGFLFSAVDTRSADVHKLIIGSAAKMFAGFDSGLTKMSGNAAVLEITPENALKFIDNFLKFIDKNKKGIYKEIINILKGLEKIYADDETFEEVFKNAIASAESGEQDFYDMVDAIVSGYNDIEEFDKELAALSFKNSYLKSSLSKQGDVYTHEFAAQLVYKDKKAFAASGNTKVVQTAIDKKGADEKNPIDLANLNLITGKTIKKVNPATEMTISWWNSPNQDWTWVDITRVEGTGFESIDRNMENNSMYLPMRIICEWFGEDVTWDNSERKAYVTRGGQKIEMTGKIIDNRTFIKIRDFEKLGYTVDYHYDSEYKEHTVLLKKN